MSEQVHDSIEKPHKETKSISLAKIHDLSLMCEEVNENHL